jgi:MFS family permease
MLAVVHGGGDDVSAWALAGPELLAGIGMGAMLAPLFDFVLAGVDDDEVGSASGVLNAMQQMGGATGIAVLGTAFFAVAASRGLVTGGRLGDIFGRRRLFLLGVAGFTATSVLCGAAPSDELLIAFRLLQGAFAAIMVPQGFGILRQVFPPDEIQKAFGLFGPVIGLAAVLGPVLGGALTDGDLFGLGWRAIFLVNLPLGLLALAGAARL